MGNVVCTSCGSRPERAPTPRTSPRNSETCEETTRKQIEVSEATEHRASKTSAMTDKNGAAHPKAGSPRYPYPYPYQQPDLDPIVEVPEEAACGRSLHCDSAPSSMHSLHSIPVTAGSYVDDEEKLCNDDCVQNIDGLTSVPISTSDALQDQVMISDVDTRCVPSQEAESSVFFAAHNEENVCKDTCARDVDLQTPEPLPASETAIDVVSTSQEPAAAQEEACEDNKDGGASFVVENLSMGDSGQVGDQTKPDTLDAKAVVEKKLSNDDSRQVVDETKPDAPDALQAQVDSKLSPKRQRKKRSKPKGNGKHGGNGSGLANQSRIAYEVAL